MILFVILMGLIIVLTYGGILMGIYTIQTRSLMSFLLTEKIIWGAFFLLILLTYYVFFF